MAEIIVNNEDVKDETKDEIKDEKIEDVKDDVKTVDEKVEKKLDEIKAETADLREEKIIYETKKAIDELKSDVLDYMDDLKEDLKNDELTEIAESDDNDILEERVTILENKNAEDEEKKEEEKPDKKHKIISLCAIFGLVGIALIYFIKEKNKGDEK